MLSIVNKEKKKRGSGKKAYLSHKHKRPCIKPGMAARVCKLSVPSVRWEADKRTASQAYTVVLSQRRLRSALEMVHLYTCAVTGLTLYLFMYLHMNADTHIHAFTLLTKVLKSIYSWVWRVSCLRQQEHLLCRRT